MQSLCVALFSGVIATVLFFQATDMVKHNPRQLAVVEATQCGEVVFTLLGGIFLLQDGVPDKAGLVGIAVIVAGMIGNSLAAQGKENKQPSTSILRSLLKNRNNYYFAISADLCYTEK